MGRNSGLSVSWTSRPVTRVSARRPGDVYEYGTRGVRLYDLSLNCRGGGGRPRAGRAAAMRLRQYPAGYGVLLLVERGGRAGRGSRNDHQNPRLAQWPGFGGDQG